MNPVRTTDKLICRVIVSGRCVDVDINEIRRRF